MPVDAAFLEGVELFRALDAEDRRNLSGSMGFKTAEKGDVLFHQGDAGDSLFVVHKGIVELFVRDHAGQEIVLHHVGPRDAFGELSLLDGRPRTATARVMEDAELMILDRAELLALVRKTPDMALDILSHMSQETRRADELLRSRVSRNVNVLAEEKLTPFEHVADWIAMFSGSLVFLVLNTLWFAIWIIINTVGIPGVEQFDPFPFGLLTMIVSLEAIFLSIFVLISQNRQASKDRVRSDIEYEVNVKAEMEVAHLHEKLDRIADQVAARLSRLERGDR
jgi:CRP/FNR family cyclic AMP-dependent transcriptional regulator